MGNSTFAQELAASQSVSPVVIAQRILAAAASPIPVGTATAPTITAANGYAAPTLVTGQAYPYVTAAAASASVPMLGGPTVPHTALGAPFRINSTSSNGAYDQNAGGTGEGIAFSTDAQAFEVLLSSAPGTFRFRFTDMVTGARTYYDWTSTGDYLPRYLKVDLGSRAIRTVEAYGIGYAWGGVVVASGDRVWAPAAILAQPTMFVAPADSYCQGYWMSPIASRIDLFPILADMMGMRLIKSGVGGQGAVKTDPAFNKTLLDRANAGDLARPGPVELMVFYPSLNDYNQSPATIQANWTAITQRAMLDQPNAIILAFTGFMAPAYVVDTAHNAAFTAAFTASMDSKRMALIDLFNDPSPLFTPGAQLASNMYSDAIHLKLGTPALGVNYVAPRMASTAIAALRQMARP
jgi:hypothetical protein